MQRITAWVLDTATAQCAAWRATRAAVHLAVNVSPSNLLEPGFVDLVRRPLDATACRPTPRPRDHRDERDRPFDTARW